MLTMKRFPILMLLMLALFVFALPALAGDKDEHRITIIDEDGDTYICVYDDDTMRVYNEETGEEVADVDFKEIEEAIEEAMEEVEDALESAFESLADLDIDFHFGDGDNHFRLELDDEDFDIDFDDLFESIGDALDDIDFDAIHHRRGHRIRISGDQDDVQDLVKEIEALKAEIKDLKKDIEKKDGFDF